MKLTDLQKMLLDEAISVHDEEIRFGEKLSHHFGISVTPGEGVLIEQIEIITGRELKTQ